MTKQHCIKGFQKAKLVVILVVVLLGCLIQFKVLQRLGPSSLPQPLQNAGIHSSNTLLNINASQDEKCKRSFEWSLVNHWETENMRPIDFRNLPENRILRMERNWKPSNASYEITKHHDTHIHMSITVRSRKLQLTVIDMQIFDGTQTSSFASTNLWHRLIPQYNSWVALQTAQRKYDLISEQVVYYFNCQKNGKNLDDLPNEWEKIGAISCDDSLLKQADVLIVPPTNGFLWDLAWDLDFLCYNSDMFKTFANMFVDKSSPIDPPEPMGCIISRQGRPSRTIANWNETITMMKEIFPRVRVLTLTQYHTTDETVQILEECRVLFGVHGAGHMNALFTRPGVAVVEMVGNAKPAYFRNINMLLGQYYESIRGDHTKGMSGTYTVNLTEAREALIRANDHSNLWIQHYGHWR
jgi:hypothetical protein